MTTEYEHRPTEPIGQRNAPSEVVNGANHMEPDNRISNYNYSNNNNLDQVFEPYIPPNPWDTILLDICSPDEFITEFSHALAARSLKRLNPLWVGQGVSHNRVVFWSREADRPYYKEIINLYEVISNHLEQIINDAVEVLRKAGIPNPETFFKAVGKAIKQSRSREFVSSVITFLGGMIVVENFLPDTTPEVICCRNGLIDIAGSEPVRRQPIDGEIFTIFLDLNVEDILEADPKPVKFFSFLWQLFHNEDTILMARYCLSTFIANRPMKIFMIWWKSGNNGKTTLQDLLYAVLGDKIAIGLPAAILMTNSDQSVKRFGIIGYMGKAGIFCDESADGDRLNLSFCKAVSSGGGLLTGERKGQDPVKFPVTGVTVLLTNPLPVLYPADDQAFLSRFIILPFGSTFCHKENIKDRIQEGYPEERIHAVADGQAIIKEIVRDERGSIIRQLITDYIDLRDNLDMKIPESEESQNAKSKYLDDQDKLKQFYLENFTANPEGFVTNTQLKELWIAAGFREKGVRTLTDHLMKKYPFISRDKQKGVRGVAGISILEDAKTELSVGWNENSFTTMEAH